jgi:DtxR family transcriptional regulator, Mn-dependent transcriptional regulator
MEQKSTQDYLKAIYGLARNGDLVSTNEISQKLDVAPASVTEMLKKLSEEGYIKYSPYHGSTQRKRASKSSKNNTQTPSPRKMALGRFAHWKRQSP